MPLSECNEPFEPDSHSEPEYGEFAEQVAAELHDGVVQWIVGAKMQAEALRAHFLAGREITPDAFDALVDSLQRAMAEARRLMHGLHGPDLPDGYWQQALRMDLGQARELVEASLLQDEQEAARAVALADLQWRFAAGTEPLRESLAQQVYRLLYEVVWNALRHAKATHITVAADRLDSPLAVGGDWSLRLVVTDDGCGFDPELVPHHRHGVRGVAQRAHRAGGTCQLQTAPGKGTRWEFALPVSECR